MSNRKFKADQGYITFAFGKEYLKLAYVQALSIKASQSINNYAVIVDKTAAEELDNYSHVFDEVIKVDYEASGWDMSQHWKVFGLTPWRETVLLDADMVFNESVDHWWPTMRLRDVCLTHEIKDFRENTITSRKCRRLFDENLLPDVYAGFMYFRYTELASEFFGLVKSITHNWDWIAKEHFIKNDDYRIRIDEIFALAARIFGTQYVTLPVAIPTFTHGKEVLWKLSEQQPWFEQLFVELTKDKLLIGHYYQRVPLHYHHKDWITENVIRNYERKLAKFTESTGRVSKESITT